MSTSMGSATLRHLAEATSYRDFLERHFKDLKGSGSRNGFASFSRSAGFSARSYPREVTHGTRKLTAKALPKFIRALKLKGDAAKYFSYLVYRDHPEEMRGTPDLTRIQGQLCKYRERIQRQVIQPDERPNLSVYREQDWPSVYASLGTLQGGASLEEVSSRSAIAAEVCKRILGEMCRLDLVEFEAGSEVFRAKQPHLVFERLGGDEKFKEFFLRNLKSAAKQAETGFSGEDRLFFTSAISVRSEQLPELKRELRAVLSRFVDHSEIPDGDCIAKLTCAFLSGA